MKRRKVETSKSRNACIEAPVSIFRFFDFSIFRFSALIIAGCAHPPAVNPWVDDSIPQRAWSTPSADSVLVAQAEPAIRHRDYPPSTAPAVDESVPHYPLWWEDPVDG